MVKTQILNDGTGKCARIKAFVEIITEVEFFDIFKLAAVYPWRGSRSLLGCG